MIQFHRHISQEIDFLKKNAKLSIIFLKLLQRIIILLIYVYNWLQEMYLTSQTFLPNLPYLAVYYLFFTRLDDQR